MKMNNLVKEFKVKLQSFTMIGWIIIVMGIAYFLGSSGDFSKDYLQETLPGLIISLLFGVFFLFFGNKSRKILIFEDRIEYIETKPKFTILWNDLILLKSFQEMGKASSNLILMTENESQSISSAFFKKDYLAESFNIIKELNKENVNLTIEDDLEWSNVK